MRRSSTLNTRPLIESANGDDCLFIPNLVGLCFPIHFHQSERSNGRLPAVLVLLLLFCYCMYVRLNNHESHFCTFALALHEKETGYLFDQSFCVVVVFIVFDAYVCLYVHCWLL